MYLDDGVSRESAPKSCFIHSDLKAINGTNALVADKEATGCYRQVVFSQVFFNPRIELLRFLTPLQQIIQSPHSEFSGAQRIRKINIKTAHDGYDKSKVLRDIGDTYRIVIWHENLNSVANEVIVTGTQECCLFSPDMGLKVVVGKVPVEADDPETGICIEQRI